ncbi:MAG: FAD-dependent monooxygenase [Pseudomonadota bacterium]
MTLNSSFDCTIVGSGPAGLIAALTAARQGLNTALVGPPINLGDKRTTALLGPSIDHLAALGLGDALASIGTPLRTMRLLDGSQRLFRAPTVSFDAEEVGRLEFGLNCPNAQLNAALQAAIDAADNLTIIQGFVARYALGGSEPKLVLKDGQTIDTRAILAADGRNSPARDAASIRVRRWNYPQTAAVGVVRHSRHHDFVSSELHTETGPYTFVPMPDAEDGSARSSFVCVLAPKMAQKLSKMDTLDATAFLQKRSLHVVGSLTLEDPVQLWPLEGLVAQTFAADGVFLMGEAAHAFPPIGAQGLNLSVRDAVDAADSVHSALNANENPASREVASRYTARRRADVWARTLGVDALNRSLLTELPFVHLGRSAALAATRLSPTFKRTLMTAGLEPFGLRALLGNAGDRTRARLSRFRPPFLRNLAS